jgi:hypothetical protein
MKDADFNALKLRTQLMPSRSRWPTETLHFQKMHRVADKVMCLVTETYEQLAEIDANPDLSPDGRKRQRAAIGAKALAEFQSAKELAFACEGVDRQLAVWQGMTGATIKPAANIAEASIHAQIRDRLHATKDKMSFVEKYAGDPVVASAIMTAPLCLSGLSDAEVAMVRKKIESHVDPRIIEAREQTTKALKETEAGWQRAQQLIAERAGLRRNADGSYGEPAVSDADADAV